MATIPTETKARQAKTKWVAFELAKDYGQHKKGHVFPRIGVKHAKLFTDQGLGKVVEIKK